MGSELFAGRYTRQSGLVDLQKFNRPVAVVGTGAIGSHVAECLAKMGAPELLLIDPDTVSVENLGVQGFTEADLGELKVEAVRRRVGLINSSVKVKGIPRKYSRGMVPRDAAVISAVDSITVRGRLFEDATRLGCPLFIDGRMSAETFQVYTVPAGDEAAWHIYRGSLFPAAEAFRDGCTAKATIYCAFIVAGFIVNAYKQWGMKGDYLPVWNCNVGGWDAWR